MKTYHLTWDKGTNKWKLNAQGTTAHIFPLNENKEPANKDEAIKISATLLRMESELNNYPISLRIHNKDGSFSSDGERTYGADPGESYG